MVHLFFVSLDVFLLFIKKEPSLTSSYKVLKLEKLKENYLFCYKIKNKESNGPRMKTCFYYYKRSL